MKRKIYFWAKKYINGETIKMIIMLVIIGAILLFSKSQINLDWKEIVDVGILVSLFLFSISEMLANFIWRRIAKRTEDYAKLTVNYEELVKKYQCTELVTYRNVVFPEQCLCMRKDDKDIIVKDDKNKYYNLPSQVQDNSKELMEAHKESAIYNQINVRLDDLVVENNRIILYTSRTHFFDSLITNRCSDYVFGNRKTTIREIYEPGPFIKPLRFSKLSNHLGFNGFVITNDGKIPFIYRKNTLSIAKHTWGTSIGASLKTKHALKFQNDYELTVDSLGDAIVGEVKEELNVSNDNALTRENALNGIFAFYRDLVEGGKPQLLFSIHLEDIDAKELQKRIEMKCNKQKDDVTTDGNKVVFYTLEDLKKATFKINKMEIYGKEYIMMPSAVVSVVLLLKSIEK